MYLYIPHGFKKRQKRTGTKACKLVGPSVRGY